MTDKQVIIFIAIMIMIAVIAVAFVFLILKSLRKLSALEQYEVQGHRVTAITKVVGRRKVTSFGSSYGKNNAVEKKYTYVNKKCAEEDVESYFMYLEENEGFGFGEVIEKDNGITRRSASRLIGTGKLQVDVYYDLTGYTVCISSEE